MINLKKKNPVLIGAVILTASGLITRFIGFFYRIYLSGLLGAEGLGLYHLVFPISGICFSLCCGPIQTAISRFVAANTAVHRKEHRRYFYGGLFLSLSLSLFLAGGIFVLSGPISSYILLEPRCDFPLKLLALSIPFSSIHSCVAGYYYGIKKAGIPAFSQLLEQFVRVLSVWIFVEAGRLSGQTATPAMAVGGMAVGEAISALFLLAAISGRFAKQRCQDKKEQAQIKTSVFSCIYQIFFWSVPLAVTRLTLSVLQSGESVLIPRSLRQFGLTNSEALSLYGILTGMAMPFILFPSTLTNSLSVMLLPDMAQAQSAGHNRRILRTTGRVTAFSLYIGILFAGLFLAFGKNLGELIFHNATAGSFITVLAWLCPFLYLSTTMGSILNGLGYTKITFYHNLTGMAGCLFFIILLVPIFGFPAVLWGNLADQLITSGLHIRRIRKEIPFAFFPGHQLFRPAFILTAGLLTGRLIFSSFSPVLGGFPSLLSLGLECAYVGLFYLLFLYLTKKDKKQASPL